MVVPFAPPTVGYLWIRPIGRGQPLRTGLGKNDLAWFSKRLGVLLASGMSRDTKQYVELINVSGNAFSDITDARDNAE